MICFFVCLFVCLLAAKRIQIHFRSGTGSWSTVYSEFRQDHIRRQNKRIRFLIFKSVLTKSGASFFIWIPDSKSFPKMTKLNALQWHVTMVKESIWILKFRLPLLSFGNFVSNCIQWSAYITETNFMITTFVFMATVLTESTGAGLVANPHLSVNSC